MQVKCPKCATVLKVADPTGRIKIKCPKCATILQVGGAAKPASKPAAPQAAAAKPNAPANPKSTQRSVAKPSPASPKQPASQSPAAASATPLAAPADPFGTPDLGGQSDGGFDFLDLPGPAADQPVRQFTQVAAPKRKPQPAPKAEPAVGDEGGAGIKPKKETAMPSGISKGTIAVLVGGVITVVLLTGVGIVMLASGSGKTSVAKRKAPDGFEFKAVNGVSAFMPEGEQLKDLPGQMEMVVVVTDSLTHYVLGSTTANNVDMKVDKLKSRLQRLMAAGIIGGSPHKRKEYEGHKFRLDQGFKLPDMEIEVFQSEGRIVVMGVSNSASGGGGTYVVGQESDPEMRKVFLESFEIGPAKKGW